MAKEEKANPYNMEKSWHKVEEQPFVSSNNMFFPDPKTENVVDEGKEIEEEQAQEELVEKDKPYKRPNYKKRYDDLKKHYDSKLNEFKQR